MTALYRLLAYAAMALYADAVAVLSLSRRSADLMVISVLLSLSFILSFIAYIVMIYATVRIRRRARA